MLSDLLDQSIISIQNRMKIFDNFYFRRFINHITNIFIREIVKIYLTRFRRIFRQRGLNI